MSAARQYRHRAWAFRSPLSWRELAAALARQTAEPWQERESSYYGDYLRWFAAAPHETTTRLRLFREEDTLVLDARWESRDPDADRLWLALEAWIAGTLLPAVSAVDVAETETYD